jgi:hypothetical protein
MSEVKRYHLPDLLILDGRTVVDSVDYDIAQKRIAEAEAEVDKKQTAAYNDGWVNGQAEAADRIAELEADLATVKADYEMPGKKTAEEVAEYDEAVDALIEERDWYDDQLNKRQAENRELRDDVKRYRELALLGLSVGKAGVELDAALEATNE